MAYYYSPFRKDYKKKDSNGSCDFCDVSALEQNNVVRYKDQTIVENEYYRWLIALYPKFEGHTMVLPKRHVTDLSEESDEEVVARNELFVLASETLRKLYPNSGIEIFLQTGENSDATIKHLHWHVVPASLDDKLRSFEKLGHFYTVKEGEEKVVIFPVEIKLAREDLLKALADVLGNKK